MEKSYYLHGENGTKRGRRGEGAAPFLEPGKEEGTADDGASEMGEVALNSYHRRETRRNRKPALVKRKDRKNVWPAVEGLQKDKCMRRKNEKT